MNAAQRVKPVRSALRIASIYAIFGSLWILFSDLALLRAVGTNTELLASLQSVKGAFFILVTTFLLYLLVVRAIRNEASVEQALHASERSFREVFDGVSDPIFLHDPDTGAILDVNRAAVALYGYTREEFSHLDVGKLSVDIEPYTLAGAQQWFKRARAGEHLTFEWQGKHRDGRVFWLEITMTRALIDAQPRLLATAREIDERKRVEIALRRNQDNLNRAQQVAHLGSWFLDVLGNRLEWSDETYRIFGVEKGATLTLETFMSAVHPDDHERVMSAWCAALAGQPYDLEHRIVVDGQIKWVKERAEVRFDSKGAPIEAVGTVQEITERRKLEDAQRQLLKRLDTVANASPVLIWSVGLDKGGDWFNRRWLAFTGRSMEQELGEGWLENVHPDDQARVKASFGQAFDQRATFSMEYRLRRADGEYRWLMDRGMPRNDADGVFLGFIGSCLDITAERRAQQALRESEERLRLALEAAQQGLYDRNLPGDRVTVSPEYALMLGYDPATFVETPADWLARLHPDDRARVTQLYEQYLSGEVSEYRTEFRLATEDGEWKWILSVGAITERASDGSPVRMVGTHTDIDALKRAEAEIELFRFVIENAGQEIYLISLDGKIRYANRAAATSLGYSVAEMQTLHIGDLDPSAPPIFAAHVQALRCGDEPAFETVHVTKQGQEVPKEIKAFYLRMNNDEFVCSFAQDITERKVAEDALKSLNSALEQRVTERTRALEAANAELESFSYSVSHDLKAPLRGIDGYSQILLEDYAERLDEEGQQFLLNIRRGVSQMHELIEDMLAYSRMERRAVESRSIDLKALTDMVVSTCLEAESKRSAAVRVRFETLTVQVDCDGLALVLRNLIENALKFACSKPDGVVEIDAQLDARRLLISVRDNGIGFDMKYHDRIFDIFQRLHRVEDYPGTGIGLALVKKAVNRMGGRVWAESAPEQGATFFVELPQP